MKLIDREQTLRIRELRAMGGEWRAERIGFGYFAYHGVVNGRKLRVQSYAYPVTSPIGVVDDQCVVRDHLYDGDTGKCLTTMYVRSTIERIAEGRYEDR